MNPLERHLVDIVQTVWKCTLSLDIVPCDLSAPTATAECRSTVTIEGAWNGTLSISCPADLTREAAAVFFGRPPAELSDREALDALGELANMTGGNLKAVLPGPCRLSTPRSTAVAAAAASAGTLRQDFSCDGRRFSVELSKEDRP